MTFQGDIKARILDTLKAEPLHGYEIVRRLKLRRLPGRFTEGQVYPYIHELEKSGMVTSEWLAGGGPIPRRVYEITQSGRTDLVRPHSAWERVASRIGPLLVAGLRTGEANNA